jgi:hypothetical protein
MYPVFQRSGSPLETYFSSSHCLHLWYHFLEDNVCEKIRTVSEIIVIHYMQLNIILFFFLLGVSRCWVFAPCSIWLSLFITRWGIFSSLAFLLLACPASLEPKTSGLNFLRHELFRRTQHFMWAVSLFLLYSGGNLLIFCIGTWIIKGIAKPAGIIQ